MPELSFSGTIGRIIGKDVSTSKNSDKKLNMLNRESTEKKVKIEERHKKESCEKGDTAETAVFN